VIHTARIEVPDALHHLDAASFALATYLHEADDGRAIGDQVHSLWVTATATGWVVHVNGPRPCAEAIHHTITQVLAW
jgi:hypothetical protein